MCIDCHLHPDAAPDASLRAGCVWKHGSPVHRAVGVARAGRRPCLWSAVHPWQGTSWLASVDSFSVRHDKGQAALKSRIRGPRTRAHPLVGNTQAGNRQVPTGGPKAACCRSGRKEPRAHGPAQPRAQPPPHHARIAALSKPGPANGLSLALPPPLRSHPWGGHGYDPVR